MVGLHSVLKIQSYEAYHNDLARYVDRSIVDFDFGCVLEEIKTCHFSAEPFSLPTDRDLHQEWH